MASSEEIAHQQSLLLINRYNLAHFLKQADLQGAAHVTPVVVHGLREARTNIARIKGILRSWHVLVEDHPDDMEPSEDGNIPATVPQSVPGSTTIHVHGGNVFNQPNWNVQGNVYNIAHDLNIGANPSKDTFLAALRQFKSELDKARDLPNEQAEEMQEDVDSAIKALDKPQPNTARAGERLENVKKMLDTMKDAVPSALALGKLIGMALAGLQGLSF